MPMPKARVLTQPLSHKSRAFGARKYAPKLCPSCKGEISRYNVGVSGRGYICTKCFTTVSVNC